MVAAQKRDPGATRATILEAAERLFVERGYGQVGIAEIASEAGVTKSLIHHHFGSKQELWDNVKLYRFRAYAEQQRALLEQGPASLDMLVDSVEAYFRFLQANPQMLRLMTWVHLERDKQCISEVSALVELGAARIAEAQAGGLIRANTDPRHIIASFVGMSTHWFEHRHEYCQPSDDDPDYKRADEAFLASMKEIFVEGIRPR